MLLLVSGALLNVYSQNDTPISSINSPYSRYGYGKLSDQSFGRGKAMGGVGYAMTGGESINILNPASYSDVDSLTFIFDAGMSMQNANFNDGTNAANARNAALDYVALQFRLLKGLGLTAGYVPFSTVGYSFNDKANFNGAASTDGYVTNEYSGNGNLQQVFLGLGYSPFKGFSFGANISYLYGKLNRSVVVSSSESSSYTYSQHNTLSVRDYRFDAGIRYTFCLPDKKNEVTLGAVYSLGHSMNSDVYQQSLKTSSSTVVSAVEDTIRGANDFPTIYGAGLGYKFDEKLFVEFDWQVEKWGKCYYQGQSILTDRMKWSFGVEYVPDKQGRSYFKRVRYRLGAYYSEPYVKINGNNGADEFGVSLGAAFPMFSSKSMAHVSFQYSRVNSKISGMLDETYLRLNLGLTFNERWFAKIKVR